MPDIMGLQNGSDIRGVACPSDGGNPVDLTSEACAAIGAAFARWLSAQLNKPCARLCISIGRDSRITGERLLAAFARGAEYEGVQCISFGLATTPAMFMSTVSGDPSFDGAVMVTASHLPYERNGFKFFTAQGGLDKKDITAILTAAGEITVPCEFEPDVAEADFMEVYSKLLRDRITDGAKLGPRPLEGLHIIVDAGNGAGGFFASRVLEPLGADTSGSLFLEPDGMFPNHAPNPENEKAMQSITEAVLNAKCDLGIIFDTDVDRAGAVLADGRELNRNRLIAMIAAIELRDHPGATIVTDSITSTGLAEFIADRGGLHRRFKRGYKNVINEAIRLNREGIDTQVAMETSGHGALMENYFLDDGAYLMVKLTVELARAKRTGATLASLIDGLREPAESREYRMKLSVADFAAYGKDVLAQLSDWINTQPGFTVAPDSFEGVRVNADASHGDGWFLLRMSLHEPLMPLNIESERAGGVSEIASALYPFLRGFEGLDSSALSAK